MNKPQRKKKSICDPLNILFIGFVILIFYSTFRFGYKAVQPPGMFPTDYSVYTTASQRLLNQEPFYRLYDPSPFKYSPTFLYIFTYTFYLVPKPVGWFIWCFLSVLGFSLSTLWLWRWANIIPAQSALRPKFFIILILSFVISWHGFLEHFSYGQIDMLLFTLFTAAIACSEKKSLQWIAPFLIALCLITKPPMGILLLYFLFTRRWKIIAHSLILSIFLLFLPALHWGLGGYLHVLSEWQHKVAFQQTQEFMLGNLNQSFATNLTRLFFPPSWVLPITWIVLGLIAISSTFLTFGTKKILQKTTPRHRAHLLSFTFGLYLMSTPLSWRWLTFLWLPFFMIIGMTATQGIANDWKMHRFKGQYAFIALICLSGLLLQQGIAHTLGIPEIDILSYYGFYGWINFFFVLTCLYSITKKVVESKRPS